MTGIYYNVMHLVLRTNKRNLITLDGIKLDYQFTLQQNFQVSGVSALFPT